LGCDNRIAEMNAVVNWQYIKNIYFFGAKRRVSPHFLEKTGSNDRLMW
jgi:hypothetical protein